MASLASWHTPRDRLADWAVVTVVLVALLLGWGVMALAEGQRAVFEDPATGLRLEYPAGWLVKVGEDGTFRASDPQSGDFRTLYEVRAVPLDTSGPVTPALSMILNNISLARAAGEQTTAYRLLGSAQAPEAGTDRMEARYVFVQEGSNLFVQQLPVVVLGLDVAVADLGASRALVFTLQAAEGNFERAEREFLRFVRRATD